MAIPGGKRLGPYEILSEIGAGGMGEVHRARDTRLDRIVAIKILADHFADGGLRERFDREARRRCRISMLANVTVKCSGLRWANVT